MKYLIALFTYAGLGLFALAVVLAATSKSLDLTFSFWYSFFGFALLLAGVGFILELLCTLGHRALCNVKKVHKE